MENSITIRRATAEDAATIKRLIRAAQLDPTSLKWERFSIAEVDGTLAGIGQIKTYPGCEELGSLVTLPRYQNRGVASALIAELETRAGRPLYLFCEHKMEPFYRRFGYEPVPYAELPAFLKLKFLMPIVMRVFGIRVSKMRKV